jgi:hypothetical protein
MVPSIPGILSRVVDWPVAVAWRSPVIALDLMGVAERSREREGARPGGRHGSCSSKAAGAPHRVNHRADLRVRDEGRVQDP